VRASFPDKWEYSVPITVPGSPRYHRDWVAMSDIPMLVGELQPTLRQLERIRDASRVLGLPESPDDVGKINEYRRLIFRLQTEPYRRWANGFTCLCFALIGMPVAMIWRHADVLTNFFVCFLPILAVYYPLLMLGEDFTTSGKLPPIFFWTGNVILVLPAIWLLRRVIRH
jgi:lipopolysaccharide export system permease protein